MIQPKAKPLRQTMPTVAAWIDELREAFGADAINPAIRNGVAGGAQFYATEGGQTIGCDAPPAGHAVSVVDMVFVKREGGDK
jgi:hypothetical protein